MVRSMSTSLIVRGVLAVIIGIIAVAWPSITVFALVIVFAVYTLMNAALEMTRAVWSFVGGFFELFAASKSGKAAGTRAMLILAGLVSIAFGLVIAARPGIGAITLALLFGLYSLIFGVWEIVAGVDLRRSGRNLRPIMPDSA